MNWQDIIHQKTIYLIKWFYKTLLPESLENPLPFDDHKNRDLYRDWDCPQWFNFYLNPPKPLFKIFSDLTNSEQIDESDDLVNVRDKFLILLKDLKSIYSQQNEYKSEIDGAKEKVKTKLLPVKLNLMVGYMGRI